MSNQERTEKYNYEKFVPESFMPLMNFAKSPNLGEAAPDFPLWDADTQVETSLSAIWSANLFTVVEFGSFT
jgi:hypothetical protein